MHESIPRRIVTESCAMQYSDNVTVTMPNRVKQKSRILTVCGANIRLWVDFKIRAI